MRDMLLDISMGQDERKAFSEANSQGRVRLILQRFLPLVFLFLLGLVPRLIFQASYDRNLPFEAWENPKLDSWTFHIWAERIADGDVLSRNMIHPYHRWALAIATPQEWEEWYGKQTFHQAPLYPYLIGATYALLGKDPGTIHRLQAILGALLVPLLFSLTRTLFGTRAGLGAALLTAFYGPLILYENVLLRTSFLAFSFALLVFGSLKSLNRPGICWSLGLGLLQGLAILLKPTSLLFLPLTLFATVRLPQTGASSSSSSRATRAAAYLLFLLVPFIPVILRNTQVDAKTLGLTTRGPEVFVCGNAEGSTGIGWFPANTEEKLLHGHARTILRETRGKLFPTITETLKTHPSVGSYVMLLLGKVGALLSPLEIPNNINYYEIREAVPALGKIGFVTFSWVGPLALLGLFFALRKRSPGSGLLFCFVLIGFGSAAGLFVVGRFRVPLMPLVLPFAGLTLSILGTNIASLFHRTEKRRAILSLLLTGISVTVLAVGLGHIPVSYRIPSRSEALFGLGGSLHSAGKLLEADKLYADAQKSATEEPGVALHILLRRGALHLELRRPDAAATLLQAFFSTVTEERFILESSMLFSAHVTLGKAHRALGDSRLAALELSKAARLANLAPTLKEDVLQLLETWGENGVAERLKNE